MQGKRPLKQLQFFIIFFLSSLTVLSLIRVFQVIIKLEDLKALPHWGRVLLDTLLMGLRFDTVITCYILILPLAAVAITSSIGYEKKRLRIALITFLSIFTGISLFISMSDIPYFLQFGKKINSSIFNWAGDFGFVTKMILEEKSFVIYVIAFIILMVFVVWGIKSLVSYYFDETPIDKLNLSSAKYRTLNITLSILILALCIIGGRGRLEKKSPIRVGTAYFSQYNLPNQLAQNASFTLLQSVLEDNKNRRLQITLIPTQQALKNVKEYLQLPQQDSLHYMEREVKSQNQPLRANVVLVLMEGMGSAYMQHFHQQQALTPFLDSLAMNSCFFENAYTAGVHTMNGIYSTLFSFPSFLKKHPLKITNVPQYNGIARTLQNKGYSTLYFSTHDDQFDNVGGFIKPNGFEQIISQKDYPSEKILSTLGVPDDYMFKFAQPILQQAKEPFFATFLTTSNHSPIIIPEYFKPTQEGSVGIVQYSDWAIRTFISACRKQPWFENTIFVFIADHGTAILSNDYDMPLANQHSPLIFYSPKYIKPQIITKMAGQIDIYPTIMGLLNEHYTNDTFGIDLLHDSRPYIYFTADDKIGCLDSSYFYVNLIEQKIEKLYDLKSGDKQNVIESHPETATKMKEYAYSMLQASQWVEKNK